jgi:uncharacterized protein YbjT (DUF2867 family)
MKVILFGASGMVGQSVLRECLHDPDVEEVLSIARRPLGQGDGKIRELVHPDFSDFSGIAGQLTGYDACFFCLGISAVGLQESEYRKVTYELTLAAARVLAERNPRMVFVYVSGAGTDDNGDGRTMWARVKGQTENALLALPFKAAYMFRPGYIQPQHGIHSKTRLYRAGALVLSPVYPLLKRLFPKSVMSGEELGRAMLEVAKHGSEKHRLESADLVALAADVRNAS